MLYFCLFLQDLRISIYFLVLQSLAIFFFLLRIKVGQRGWILVHRNTIGHLFAKFNQFDLSFTSYLMSSAKNSALHQTDQTWIGMSLRNFNQSGSLTMLVLSTLFLPWHVIFERQLSTLQEPRIISGKKFKFWISAKNTLYSPKRLLLFCVCFKWKYFF